MASTAIPSEKKEKDMASETVRVTIQFPEEGGREQIVPMLEVDWENDEIGFIVCDPMYKMTQPCGHIESTIGYISDVRENEEIIPIGLPDGVVHRAEVAVVSAEQTESGWNIVLSVTPMYPVMPWPWSPRRGHGWYGGDE